MARAYTDECMITRPDPGVKFDELERRMTQKLDSHDQAIVGILKAIRELMTPPASKKRPIGFVTHE